MPELPEVETIARHLAHELVGATFTSVDVARADYVVAPPPSVQAHLVGRRVVDVQRQGKRIVVVLAPSGEMLLHLGMSGRVVLARRGAPLEPHTHLVIGLGDRDVELRMRDPRRFGGVWVSGGAPSRRDARRGRNGARPGPLGPDALSIGWPELRDILRARRQIKALLLDQRCLAGLGNIYVDEALWAARVHPLLLAAELPDAKARALHRGMKRILAAAIRHGGSTLRDYRDAEGREGAFQRRHRVYGREGEPCLRCGRRIVVLQAAGRSTRICPRCQGESVQTRRRSGASLQARPRSAESLPTRRRSGRK